MVVAQDPDSYAGPSGHSRVWRMPAFCIHSWRAWGGWLKSPAMMKGLACAVTSLKACVKNRSARPPSAREELSGAYREAIVMPPNAALARAPRASLDPSVLALMGE